MRQVKALFATALVCFATGAAAQPQPEAWNANEAERLAGLGRLWITFDLFSPYLASRDPAWEAALAEAIPAVRSARTETEMVAALNAMLARSGDPAARIYTPIGPPLGEAPQPVTLVADAAVANCTAMTAAAAEAPAFIAQMAAAPRGAVIDCREFRGSGYMLGTLIRAIAAARTEATIASGATLVRSYDGYPPDTGDTSGGYTRGIALQHNPPIFSQGAAIQRPLVFLIDGRVASHVSTLGALQAAGLARIVSTQSFGGALTLTEADNQIALITTSMFVYPNGAPGFQPDALAPADDAARALDLALAQLDQGPSRPPAAAPLASPPLPAATTDQAGVPSLEQRLAALFRLWGTIEYFFPYRHLTDQPWAATLDAAIPEFIAADTRGEYEIAVLRLAALTQDTHTRVQGVTATPYFNGTHRPAINVRFIEDRLIVLDVQDPALADRIAVGDEIVAIDGVTLENIEQRITPLLAYSTPQGLHYMLTVRALTGPENSTAALRLRGGDGRVRTVRAPRQAPRTWPSANPTWRMLDGDVGYINLEHLSPGDVDRALEETFGARALIFDLRGYPQGTGWQIAPRIARRPDPIVGARFSRPRYAGFPYAPQQEHTAFAQEVPPQDDRAKFTGPIYVLTNERAISQSEHTALWFEAAADVTFVGEPTNGANGDITYVNLPGGLSVRFTGHDVRWPDGRQLQRVGIQPDIPVAPTIAGVRAGRDEVLEAALARARQ